MAFNGALVRNVGTQFYADLRDANVVPPADLIIFGLNPGAGTRNQNWRLIPVDGGVKSYTIQSVLTGQFAVANVALGANIHSSPIPQVWEISVVANNSRNYVIRAPNTNFVWAVPDAAGAGTVITLGNHIAGNANQQWTFTTIV